MAHHLHLVEMYGIERSFPTINVNPDHLLILNGFR